MTQVVKCDGWLEKANWHFYLPFFVTKQQEGTPPTGEIKKHHIQNKRQEISQPAMDSRHQD